MREEVQISNIWKSHNGQIDIVHLPVYVDASQSCNDLSMQLASDGSQMWTITVSQYECGYENLAPPGCTQYYWGSNTGVIKV